MTLDLAPAAVIRAAAWPIETIDVFGHPGLDRERTSLWDMTYGDPRFMKALLFASPSLFERVSGQQGRLVPRNKRVRHLETSLYRYLARAAARPTPNGLWAGVTQARFGDSDGVVPAAACTDVVPDLTPFVAAFRALAERSVYCEAALWRLGPTVRRQPDGSWRFLSRAFGGAVDLRRVEANAALDPFIERLGNAGAGTLGELSSRAEVPRQLVDQLAKGGVLIGGLAFPNRFASAWEALAVAGEALLGADRAAWKRTISVLAKLADSLSTEFDRLSPDDLIARIGQARTLAVELFAALGVEVDVPAAPFRCDLRL